MENAACKREKEMHKEFMWEYMGPMRKWRTLHNGELIISLYLKLSWR
jgi:hypothetical protein